MTALIDLVKAALWPAVAAVTLLLFYAPVTVIMESLARRADQINVIKLGAMEINVSASSLPKASSEVASILSKLNDEGLRVLLGSQEEIRYCTADEDPKTEELMQSLVAAGTGVLSTEEHPDCENYYFIKLSAGGRDAKEFVFDLLSSQIAAEHPEAKP